MGFPGDSAGKEPACNGGDLDLIPGLGRSLENATATHSSILAWRVPWTVQSRGCKESNRTEQLSLSLWELLATARMVMALPHVISTFGAECVTIWASESESCPVWFFLTLWTIQYSPWNTHGQNTGVGSHCLLQGIFPTQGLNLGLSHCRWILYQLNHQGGGNIFNTRGEFAWSGAFGLPLPDPSFLCSFYNEAMKNKLTMLLARKRCVCVCLCV